MISRLQELLHKCHDHYMEAVRVLLAYEDGAAQQLSQEERADAAFLLQEFSKYWDDLRKHANRLRETTDQIICVVWVKGDGEPIRGSFCTCSPRVGMSATPPSPTKDPEGYATVMRGLGVPEDVIAFGAVQVHYKHFQELLEELASSGKPLPPGISVDMTQPTYKTTLRRKSGVELLTFDHAVTESA